MIESASLKQRLTDDMKNAMREKRKADLAAVRLILAAIKQHEVDHRDEPMTDAVVIRILNKMLKQRRESIEQYVAAQRNDLAEQEQFEAEFIQQYLPAALEQAEVDRHIQDAIAAAGASSIRDMGKVMQTLKATLEGRADMRAVSQRIKALLEQT